MLLNGGILIDESFFVLFYALICERALIRVQDQLPIHHKWNEARKKHKKYKKNN